MHRRWIYMRRQLNSCASRALHAIYIRHTGGAPNFMPRVAFTRASFPAPSLPSPAPARPIVHREPENSLMLFFRTYPKKKFRWAGEPIRDIGRRRKRNAFVSPVREPRYPRFTVHLSAQESPSDKFQVSRLNERTVLPRLFVGGERKKKRLITRIRVILKREIYRSTRLWLTRLWLVCLKQEKNMLMNRVFGRELNDLNKAKCRGTFCPNCSH